MSPARHDGRADDALRPVRITPGYLKHPAGSALIEVGETRVLCAASIENRVPPFLVGSGKGWVTGEYAMLPAATSTRTQRESSRGRQSGRTMEIQRLVGRALRSVVNPMALGDRTLWVDCDVLQADGGTRTASITGGFVALALALARMRQADELRGVPLTGMLAAVSVGVVDGRAVLDLDYEEDAAAEVDMNVVRTDDGRYVEVQGTAEQQPFERAQLDRLLDRADRGIEQLIAMQREILGAGLAELLAPRKAS